MKMTDCDDDKKKASVKHLESTMVQFSCVGSEMGKF